jgi:hypothetical protein
MMKRGHPRPLQDDSIPPGGAEFGFSYNLFYHPTSCQGESNGFRNTSRVERRIPGDHEMPERYGARLLRIDLYPMVELEQDGDEEKARKALETAKRKCLVTNSMDLEVRIQPDFVRAGPSEA